VRIGILADIHEDVDALERALAAVRAERVSRVVVLGDVFYQGHRAAETADLLAAAGACGVWGNHDLGLCHAPDPALPARYPASVYELARALAPRLEAGGCLFSHGLPHWDATDPAAYYLGDRPESAAGRADSFAASACRVTFVGHFHRWLAATPAVVVPWGGVVPIRLAPESRYLVVAAAVCDGWCAVYETATTELIPHRLGGNHVGSGPEAGPGASSGGVVARSDGFVPRHGSARPVAREIQRGGRWAGPAGRE
jgi:predicted phosphodiesterase